MTDNRSSHDRAAVFARGTLEKHLCAARQRALAQHAIEPVQTHISTLTDGSIPFVVRVVSSLLKKPPGSESHNPFLPFEPALYVADASSTHVCILNKYNVVDRHLLIITRHFEHQETLLTLPDFRALWRCLVEYDSLAFYNSGADSGASQKHKHLQLVPLPLAVGPTASPLPLEPSLTADAHRTGQVGEDDRLPFAHALCRSGLNGKDDVDLAQVEQLALESLANYHRLLRYVNMSIPASPDSLIATSYNLLVSRRWMLLVPRTHECFQSISFNALAFVGAMLVQDNEQLTRLRAAGPLAALAYVAGRTGPFESG